MAAEPGEQQQQQEEQHIAALDALASGSEETGRAVALARLLHSECTLLLQLYKERETFLADHTPDGGRIVSLSPDAEGQQVQLLHSALRQCLGLLHCLILREEEEWGELEGEYETMRHTVRVRLEHLLHSTKDLVESEDGDVEVTPDHQCNEETDGAGGAFGLKMWTFRVLQELIHWANHATQTLHALHKERGGTEI